MYTSNPNETKKVVYNLAHKFDLNCYRNFGCVTSLLSFPVFQLKPFKVIAPSDNTHTILTMKVLVANVVLFRLVLI